MASDSMIGADVEQLRRMAERLRRSTEGLIGSDRLVRSLLRSVTWEGDSARLFRQRWTNDSTVAAAARRLEEAASELERHAREQQLVSSAGASAGVASLGVLAAVGAIAGGIRPTRTVLSGDPTTGPGVSPDRRGDREDRRIERDRVVRRDGKGGGMLSNDWAGREILQRYLTGGPTWNITDDPDWTAYMKEDPALESTLTQRTDVLAERLVASYSQGHGAEASFDDRFHADMANGEGIVGHQYLHGTNSDVGDFQMAGNAAVRDLPEGGYEVTIRSEYTWNDVIDPNNQYTTDTIKSRFAEAVTLGQADPYDIHIRWPAEVVVRLDAEGRVVSSSGYPSIR